MRKYICETLGKTWFSVFPLSFSTETRYHEDGEKGAEMDERVITNGRFY